MLSLQLFIIHVVFTALHYSCWVKSSSLFCWVYRSSLFLLSLQLAIIHVDSSSLFMLSLALCIWIGFFSSSSHCCACINLKNTSNMYFVCLGIGAVNFYSNSQPSCGPINRFWPCMFSISYIPAAKGIVSREIQMKIFCGYGNITFWFID